MVAVEVETPRLCREGANPMTTDKVTLGGRFQLLWFLIRDSFMHPFIRTDYHWNGKSWDVIHDHR